MLCFIGSQKLILFAGCCCGDSDRGFVAVLLSGKRCSSADDTQQEPVAATPMLV